MISDMSWLISAWKAKVSTSSSAIVFGVGVGKLRQGLRGLSRRLCVAATSDEAERIGGGSFQKLKADLDMARAALPG